MSAVVASLWLWLSTLPPPSLPLLSPPSLLLSAIPSCYHSATLPISSQRRLEIATATPATAMTNTNRPQMRLWLRLRRDTDNERNYITTIFTLPRVAATSKKGFVDPLITPLTINSAIMIMFIAGSAWGFATWFDAQQRTEDRRRRERVRDWGGGCRYRHVRGRGGGRGGIG